MIKIVTHNGSFHSDDVLAVAALQLYLGVENTEIIRTRDESVIAEADWVVDVGGVYEPAQKRFDHHQNGAPVRDNSIPYAAFGLIWKELGPILAGSEKSAQHIEAMLVLPVDAGDTGVSLYELKNTEITPYELYQVVNSYAPAWGSGGSKDDAFAEAVVWARAFLTRVIEKQKAQLKMEERIAQTYETAVDKRVLVFDEPVSALALIQYPEVQVVVCPDDPQSNQNWSATTVRKAFGSFASRVSFPEAWAGSRTKELQLASGINDAVFCHKARFLFIAQSKEGVLQAANMAT